MYFQLSPILGRWGVKLGLVGVVVGGAISFGSPTLAQVVPDNTLGIENSVVTDIGSGVDTISGGATRGGNLFHSFQQFSVPTNGAAFFNNAANIQNILTRVTGGSVSNIDGLIGANGAANLFLLNPNGIVFGQNAQLNIGGSFIATTASSINFADGTQFSATPGTGAPLLTVNVPIGLQFGSNPGIIVNRTSGVSLRVQPGKTLGLIGGDISWEGSQLVAPSGRVELGAVAAPGTVGLSLDNNLLRFDFPTDLPLADVSLTNSAFVDVSGGGGGSIAVNARDLNLVEGSQLGVGLGRNQGSTGAVAGNIEINAQGTITIDGQDREGFSSGLFTSVNPGGTGKAGNINIRTGSLSLTNGGAIFANTAGRGDAGNVNISASDTISFDGVGSNGRYSGIYNNVLSSGIGNGGSVNITTSSLSLTGGSFITANTFGQGNAGNVNISASDAISFDGVASDGFSSGVFSNVREGGVGNGGDINLLAGSLSLTNGAQLSANTFGQGNAGNISINVSDSIAFGGASSDGGFSAGVFSNVREGGVGNGGDINLLAGRLSLTNGARLSANTFGQGDAGNISVQVNRSISLSNSYIFSNIDAGGIGNGGNVNIKAVSLSLMDGSQIFAAVGDVFSSLPGGRGNGGKINIDVSDSFKASGTSNDGFPSGVFTNVGFGAEGQGGDIKIKARSLSLANSAQVNSSSFGQGNAGNVDVNVRILDLDTGGIFATSTLGDGGNIQLQASKELRLRNGSQISTQSSSGGNLTIESPLIIASFNGNNDIVTNALFGRGGRLEITAESIFGLTPRSLPELQILFGTDDPAQFDLSLFSSNDVASISSNPIISAAEVFLNPNLAELPTTPVDASTLVASGCSSGAENRFVVAGRGGLPPAPGDKLSTDALLTDWATLETPETENRAAVETTTPETANTTATSLVEATTWQFGSKGEIILSNADRNTPNQLNATPSNCHSS